MQRNKRRAIEAMTAAWMKTHRIPIILLGICLYWIATPAAEATGPERWHRFSANGNPEQPFTVNVKPEKNGLTISCGLGGVRTTRLREAGRTFIRLEAPGLGVSGQLGTPELPAWRQLVRVPRGARNVRIERIEPEALEPANAFRLPIHDPVYPVQPPQPKIDGITAPFAYEASAYRQNKSLRSGAAELQRFGVIRGESYYLLTVYPMDYIPANAMLSARPNLRYKIRWDAEPPKAPRASTRLASPLFERALAPMVLNPDQTGKSKGLPTLPIGLIVITDPDFSDNSELQDYVAWKTARGFHVTLVTTDQTGTSATQIKDYIQDAYDNGVVPPTGVVLVGDTSSVPCWTGTQTDTPATDLYYTLVDGSEWNTPDLYIGRLPVSNETELGHAIEKILDYEQGLMTEPMHVWEQHAAWMAGEDHYTISEGTHNAVISTYLDPAGFTSHKLYEVSEGATTSDVSTRFNAGIGLGIYSGHGDRTYWADGPQFTQANVTSLTNTIFPFVMSFACLTGDFAYGECFGETWIRDERGAMGFMGSSVTSYWGEDDVLERKMFEGAATQDQSWIGGMMQYGKDGLITHYGLTSTVHRYFEMYNLLGDPLVDIYMADAMAITATHASAISSGASSFSVSVEPDGALVAVSKEGQLLGAALSSGGTATVSLDPAPMTGQMVVTVTRHNYKPYQATVEVLASDGIVQLDRDTYGASNSITISLLDGDLVGQANQDVTVTCGSDTETVTVNSADENGEFAGSLSTSSGVATSGDGVLQLVHGQTVAVTYLDQDNGTGSPEQKTDTATADLAGPTIQSVHVMDVQVATATIHVTTDEAGQVLIEYGTSPGGPYDQQNGLSGEDTEYQIMLVGLQENTTYSFRVTATDETGNQTTDDNGGQGYTFQTLEKIDYFTEYFSSGGFDMGLTSLLLIPNGSSDYYQAGTGSATSFPTDPAGGQVLALGDDAAQSVSLGSGQTVSLYGTAYSGFYVSSNGMITFHSEEIAFLTELGTHFSQPMISPLYVDLDPSSGGTVSYKQTSDRIAVTFQGVPEYDSTNSNNFQVEMFFDGAIRITWLGVDATQCISGISQGLGTPTGFDESDLSAYAAFFSVVQDLDFSGGQTNGYQSEQVEGAVTFSTGSGLCLSTPATGENMGQWYSQEELIPLVAESVWRIRMEVDSTQTTEGKVPLWGVLIENAHDMGDGVYGPFGYFGDYLFLDNMGGANAAGTVGRTAFEVWFTPPAVQTAQWNDPDDGALATVNDGINDMRVIFRVMDNDSAGINAQNDEGMICIENMRIDRYELDTLVVDEVVFQADSITSATFSATSLPADASNLAWTDGLIRARPSNPAVGWDNAVVQVFPGDEYADLSTGDGVTDNWPIPWEANTLYQVISHWSATGETEQAYPPDFMRLGMDTPTNEVLAYCCTTPGMGNPYADPARLPPGMPRYDSQGQPYTMFMYSHSVTTGGIPNTNRLRALCDVLNTDYVVLGGATPNTGGVRFHDLTVRTIRVPSVN